MSVDGVWAVARERVRALAARERVLGVEGTVAASDGWRPGEETVVVEVAGRDSIAALAAFVRERGVPTGGVAFSIAKAPTEHGSVDALLENVFRFVEEGGIAGAPYAVQFTVDHVLWRVLAGRPAGSFQARYGFYTPCVSCHAYFHLLRGFYALDLGARVVCAGERVSHQGRVKVNQLPEALDGYVAMLASAGIELALPIRDAESDAKIESLVGPGWGEGERQLTCVFSGNYEELGRRGKLAIDIERLGSFVERELVPMGSAALAMYRRGDRDFAALLAAR